MPKRIRHISMTWIAEVLGKHPSTIQKDFDKKNLSTYNLREIAYYIVDRLTPKDSLCKNCQTKVKEKLDLL
jgi:IS30 family transposase